jgi:hypothetical protein
VGLEQLGDEGPQRRAFTGRIEQRGAIGALLLE